MQKPITLARRDYIKTVCEATNNSGLPAFVVVDVLKDVLAQMQKYEEAELKRDEAIWHNALNGGKDDGRQGDQPISDENNVE